MHILFTPNHVQLIAACYPPSAALLNAGPEYRPNSQELSRLTYYASNRPGKINKLSSELEKRVRTDCRKAQAGNVRARASLLITLAMFKALATECRREISPMSPSLLASISVTLIAHLHDIEVAARAASVFTAWAAYTDGQLIGVDKYVTREYMSCLEMFSNMLKTNAGTSDNEVRNRTHLVGLAALTGVVTSEALYHSSTQFKPQSSALMSALLVPLFQVDVATLEQEANKMKDQPTSPYLDEFRTRPARERRAASIHVHIDGDNGPSLADVANTSLRAVSALLSHANGGQAAAIMQASFDALDDMRGWDRPEHCLWLAVRAAEWTQYQYRYAIPTRLVEHLMEDHDMVHSTPRHTTLAAMVTSVFTSPTPLVNLSTSDMISSLISLVLRRVSIDPDDSLLPVLVECIASLGTHVYYADQIQDLANELVARLVLVEINGVPGISKAHSERGRIQAVRCFIAGLLGLIHAADRHCAGGGGGLADPKVKQPGISPTLSSTNRASNETPVKAFKRTKVAPDIWQDTLTLLCDEEYAVRADYASALVSYVKKEIPNMGDHTDTDGIRRSRPLADGPICQAHTLAAVAHGDSTIRFLHAVHANLFVLATSSALGICADSSSSSPERSDAGDVGDGTSTPDEDSRRTSSPDSREQGGRSPSVPQRARKSSIMLRALHNTPARLSSSCCAVLSDYSHILAMLSAIHEKLPVRGLLTGVPMLLALDGATKTDSTPDASSRCRIQVVKEVVARAWLAIGRVWSCVEIMEIVEKTLSVKLSPSSLPELRDSQPGIFNPPPEPVHFDMTSLGAAGDLPAFDTEALLNAIASQANVQEATGLDRQALLQRFTAEWTAESALRQSLEVQKSYDTLGKDTLTPLARAAPALMHIENKSLQSLARSTRGVGVTDLREALEGRNSLSNGNLSNRAPSLSTLEHASVAQGDQPFHKLAPVRSRPHQRSKLGGPSEVRDVLNRLGIGKQNGTSNMLKSSFPTLQKTESRPAVTVPPYNR